jgi:NAD(P)-dependent dehydrogenase (short-subunit alcohol dehydrogenase family)
MSIENNLKNLFSLEGKVVLLTGAAGGIGTELAKGMAGIGAVMCNCDIDKKRLAELDEAIKVEGGKSASYILDVTDKENIKSCVSSIITDHGQIDVLINCAGINKREGFLDVEEDTYDKIMAINLKGVFLLTQVVVPHMIEKKYGSIINMGSHNVVGMLGGVSIYGATKSGVAAFTRSMAIEWAKYNIRANCICPGHILTPLTTVTWEHPTRGDYLRDRIAMRRPGNPEELLGLTVLLASDASSYMTGMNYHIDGGCLAGGTPWDYDTKY